MNRVWQTSWFVPLWLMGASVCASLCEANDSTGPQDLAGSSREFLQQHCWRCHGPDHAEAGLRLDKLEADLEKPGAFKRWRGIVSRIKSGEMPPRDEPRPDSTQVADIVRRLTEELNAAAARRKSAGRVVLRRLNRVEYENTVRDLFAVNVAVKEILPEDAIEHGFDNVGAALNVSPVLIERYLEAADAVLDAAVLPVHKLPSKTERFDLYDSLPTWFVAGVYKQDDGVILFRNSGDSASDLRKFKSPAAGRYRFRIAASAHQSPTPLPMVVHLGSFVVSGDESRRLGFFDVPSEQRVIEFEERLTARNHTIKITPVGLPFVYLNHKNMPEYPGPGLKIHWIEVEGPLPDELPTESYRRVFGNADPQSARLADAERVLRDLLPRAFRRPVADEDVLPHVAVVAKSMEMGQSFESSLRAGIKSVLASPRFLYFRETAGRTREADAGSIELDDYALASRLSYFLWSTMPDETLLSLAASGNLHKSDVLRDQVERMLRHPRARAFTENFTGQWLGLRNINATTPDKALYPEFDELLQWSSVRETELFFEEILKENLSVGNFVESDFAMLNGRLASHYGIPDVHGVAFRKVALKPDHHRGGVLTHASVLKVTANGTNTSPVIRGVWVLDRILGHPAPPPPPNVPAVEPDIRGATTIREQLARHRATQNCAGCHSRIDPPGFALENYDVIGGWRSRYRIVTEQKNWVNNRVGPLAKYLAAHRYGEGPVVETADALPDGRQFANLGELKQLLLADREQIARNLTEKLITYATGAPVDFDDDEVVERILAQSRESGYGLRTLVHAVVASDLFRKR
jgi:mono/diheme cytochrome c family protein